MPSLYHSSRSGTGRGIAAAGIGLALVAVLTVLVAPDRTQLIVTVESSGANEVVVPVVYWIAVAAWAGLVARLGHRTPWQILPRAIGVGFALHALLLLADYSRLIVDRASFSSPFYWVYARLFCGVILLAATTWIFGLRRHSDTTAAGLDLLAVPVIAGALVFAVALFRADPWVCGLAVAGGLALTWAGSHGRRTVTDMGRALGCVLANERVFLVLVFLAALGLRILYLQRVMTDPNYIATGGDGPIYDQLAWAIASGDGIPVSFRNSYPLLLLGYVRFVGVVYALAGHSYFALGSVQAVLGAVTCVILYAIAKPLFGVTTARVAAVFTAVSFPLLFAAAAIGHQAVDVFVTALLVWLLCQAVWTEHASLWQWAGIGLVAGCAIAIRETAAFLLLFVVGWIWVVGGLSRRRAGQAIGAVVVGSAIVLVPLVIPMVSSADSRLRLRQHFDRLYTGQGDSVRMRDELAGPLGDPGAAIRQLRQRPFFVVMTMGRAVIHNFAAQFFTQPFGGFDLVFLGKGSRYYYGMWFYAYALAGAGIVIAAGRAAAGRARAAGIVLLLGTIVSRTVPHLFLESHYRHRVPIEPLLILMASVAAVALHESIRAAGASQRVAA